MLQDILAFCEAQLQWLFETTVALARLESPTSDKAAVDRCGREIAERLARLGARVDRFPRDEAGDHLLAEFGCGSTQVLLLGHFDTVWPVGQVERMPIHQTNGRLHGPGVFDMKAGIAIGMLAARALYELNAAPRHRVVMLWTSDEEQGSTSSRSVIEDEARRSEAVFVLEPSLAGGALKTSRKGCGGFELRVRGIPAHAGIDPSKGVSAIHELARQILDLEKLQNPNRGISVNVGIVRGGSRPNVVAEEARALIDVRAQTMRDAAEITGAIEHLKPHLPGTALEIRGGFDRPPLERTDAVVRLYKLARDVAADLGRDLCEGSTGGGSDGNLTAALGVPTLDGLGAVGDGAHALHEHVEIGELPWRAALVAGLILRFDEQPQA